MTERDVEMEKFKVLAVFVQKIIYALNQKKIVYSCSCTFIKLKKSPTVE